MSQSVRGEKQTQASTIIGFTAICEVMLECLRERNIEADAVQAMSVTGLLGMGRGEARASKEVDQRLLHLRLNAYHVVHALEQFRRFLGA